MKRSQRLRLTEYDYVIPSYKNGPITNPKKMLLNMVQNNGHWLADALNQASIPREHQRKVTYTLIYLFNELLIKVINHKELSYNTFHIDARGAAEDRLSNWFDEMHLKPKVFRKVAKTYVHCIENNSDYPRVFRV